MIHLVYPYKMATIGANKNGVTITIPKKFSTATQMVDYLHRNNFVEVIKQF